jgi:3-phosphoshikimate 1-carboxyvinyltransferase
VTDRIAGVAVLTVRAPLRGGAAEVSGAEAALFASALLAVAARSSEGVQLRVGGVLRSGPAIQPALAALERRSVKIERPDPGEYRVAPQAIRSRDFVVPGDVAAASYPAAAAAILGGSVTVENAAGRERDPEQEAVRFFDLIEEMGCRVRRAAGVTVSRTGSLHGIRRDVRDCADVFPTLAVIAACAETPTEITGIGQTRRPGADPVAAVAAGLRALGGRVTEFSDGLRVEPAPLRGGVVDACGDHRVAMAFSILGLQVPGVAIEGSDVVGRSFPDFYVMLRELGH